MIRFGTAPTAWSNDIDRTLGADTTLETCLSEAAAAGFEGIEAGHKFPTDAGAMADALSKAGLELITVPVGLDLLTDAVEDEQSALQPTIDLIKALGASVLMVHERSNAIHTNAKKPITNRPTLSDDDWPAFGRKLEQVATFTKDQGVDLVYRHHMGTVVETPDDIDRLMLETGPNLKLAFDTAHCYFGGGDPVQMLTKHLSRVGHFHAGNIRVNVLTKVRMQNMSYIDGVRGGVFTVPGDRQGAIDFQTCLNLLASSDYDRWVVVDGDRDPEDREVAKTMSEGLRALTAMAQGAGATTR